MHNDNLEPLQSEQAVGLKICYLDAFSGISGDMTVGALVDAGADVGRIEAGLGSLNTGANLSFERTMRHGIAASKFRVLEGETPGSSQPGPNSPDDRQSRPSGIWSSRMRRTYSGVWAMPRRQCILAKSTANTLTE